MLKVRFFTRDGCHLCEQADVWLNAIRTEYPFDLEVIDIDLTPDLGKEYIEKIPVVIIGDLTLNYPFTENELKVAVITSKKFASKKPNKTSLARRVLDLADEHWFGLINGFFTLFLFGAFLPPIFSKFGSHSIANFLYGVYSFFCHQLGFRSIYLFGEQSVYPRAIANMPGLATFGDTTGLNEFDLFAARAHIGDQIMGYKIALCERDLGMYFGLVLFGALFIFLKRNIKGMPLWAWLIFALVPIAIDGGTQLISQLPLSSIAHLIPLRESTPMLRGLTGFAFGFGTAWLTFPVIQSGVKRYA